MHKPTISGRAAVVTLSVAAAVIAGGALFGATARAQTSPNPTMDAQFGPTMLGPTDAKGGGDSNALIGLLLPAVRNMKQPFSIQVLNDDTNLVIPVSVNGDGRTSRFANVFVTPDPTTGRWVIHMALIGSDEYRQASAFPNVTIRILPAVQSNGNLVEPLASSDTFSGHIMVAMGDGSVVPMPFQTRLHSQQIVHRDIASRN